MAHNININNGKASMFYAGEKPWHGLGTPVDKAVTSAEAIKLAGLDYGVVKQPIFIQGPKGNIQVKDTFATVRSDTNVPLGIVGNRYTILQNREAFNFTDALVGIKEAMYHTAGALGDGEIVWILAKLNGVIEVVKNDITEKYLLLMNRHDGTGSLIIKWTGIRVVCKNTLDMALSKIDGEISTSLRHTVSMGLKVEEVRKALGIISAKEKIFTEAAKRLATVQLTQEAWEGYLKNLKLAPQGDEEGRGKTILVKILDQMNELFEKSHGNDLPGVKGTLWGGFNAVAEYVDYHRRSSGTDENRAKSILLGSGAQLKQKAWDSALVLAK